MPTTTSSIFLYLASPKKTTSFKATVYIYFLSVICSRTPNKDPDEAGRKMRVPDPPWSEENVTNPFRSIHHPRIRHWRMCGNAARKRRRRKVAVRIGEKCAPSFNEPSIGGLERESPTPAVDPLRGVWRRVRKFGVHRRLFTSIKW